LFERAKRAYPREAHSSRRTDRHAHRTSCNRRCSPRFAKGIRLRMPTHLATGLARERSSRGIRGMDTTRRGNYESGSDYVLEYGELRFTFNERDFTERVEQAAMKLGFVGRALDEGEREDLVNLAVNGEVAEPA